ncbi:hypothetical protein Patl1_31444 [Pistacia atlantica]|uniref:Uncharacterized protein n=1 Tax=Pistacia atlantica TaxID=434234 RepID=A0ACC1AR83_9ROSI|nr:hypothetical protein Patl1_31444 [Pistacia atlantica]
MNSVRSYASVALLNGEVYVFGGGDGRTWYNTENFDCRMRYWEQIASRNSKRTCYSLVVLNGKLYALGAYDGSTMVSSIEIYNSRIDSWMRADPMKQTRGYSAAAVLKESIYVVAGVAAGDKVECYKEGRGWEVIDVMGKRSFMSAFTL